MHQLARNWLRAAGIEPRRTTGSGATFAIRNIVSAGGFGASILPIEAVLGVVATERQSCCGVSIRRSRVKLSIIRRPDKQASALMQVQAAL
jgi:hypothetical protein